jgi:hypothetical protein
LKLPLSIDSARFTDALKEKMASAVCASCGNNNWMLVPEAALIQQWAMMLPAPGIPVSVAICNNCGFVRLHALGPLGLLSKDIGNREEING